MNATLELLDPGLCTLVVDQGRPVFRSLGVPVGGAADRLALALGNGLVGNPPDAGALEMTLAGATLRADAPLACVLFGAPFTLATDRRTLLSGTTFTLLPGEVLKVGRALRGLRSYLCVRGGLHPPLVLGSHSSLEPLTAGTRVPCRSGAIGGRSLRLAEENEPYPEYLWSREAGPARLRVLPGVQADWFDGQGFWAGETGPPTFRVHSASDRMGVRLLGPALRRPPRELVSEPVCPGAVQVTHDGQCIILGIDGQTIGGYPKIAQVISADLDLVGQLRPGDRIQFEGVDLERAEALYHRRQEFLRGWAVRLGEAEDFSVPAAEV